MVNGRLYKGGFQRETVEKKKMRVREQESEKGREETNAETNRRIIL